MAKKAGRTTSRKMKDKWKSKEWYMLYAPNMFKGARIGETFSDEPEKLMGRITEVTMHDLTGDFSKMHIKLRFKVGDIAGYKAQTYFIGHTFTSDYIRRLTRRKFSKTDAIIDVRTKDDYKVRIKSMAVTDKRIQGSQKQAVRANMDVMIKAEASKMTFGELVGKMINGDLAKKVAKESKTIYPIKRIEINKSEILLLPKEGKDQLITSEEIDAAEQREKEEREAAERPKEEEPSKEKGGEEGEEGPEGEASEEEAEEGSEPEEEEKAEE